MENSVLPEMHGLINISEFEPLFEDGSFYEPVEQRLDTEEIPLMSEDFRVPNIDNLMVEQNIEVSFSASCTDHNYSESLESVERQLQFPNSVSGICLLVLLYQKIIIYLTTIDQ